VFIAPLRAAPTERRLDLANIMTESSLSVSVLHGNEVTQSDEGGTEMDCTSCDERMSKV